MMTLGYAKDFYYSGDSTLMVRVRIPSIHGPYKQSDSRGQTIYNYVRDEDLPYYQSMLLPYMPKDGDVVVLSNMNDSERNPEFLIIGLLGSSYASGREL